jgi:hypothetical protein
MMNSAKQYHAYARDCLNLAEEAEQPDVRKSLIDLSRAWMQAALTEEKKPPQRNRPQEPGGRRGSLKKRTSARPLSHGGPPPLGLNHMGEFRRD